MKFRFWITWLLLPLLVAAGCSKLDRSSTYYYYFNEKIYLNECRDMIFIQFEKGLPEAQKLSIVKSDPSLKPWTYHSRRNGNEYSYDGLGQSDIAVLQSSGRISQSRLNAIKNKDGVRSVSYMLEKDGQFIAVDDTFTVMLGGNTQESQLAALARQYGCTYELWLTAGVPWDGVYNITVPKTSTLGTIRLSCIFLETGLFDWTSPNFYTFGASWSFS